MKVEDIKNTPPNILFYGPVGTQKTALVSQASNGYMLDFDGGMKIALTIDDKFKHLRHNIEFDTYVDQNPMQPNQWLLAKKKLINIVEQVQKKTWKYDAIIIDSLTGMARAIQLHVMSCAGNSLQKPLIQHYGSMISELEAALTLLRACNVLRLVTAHELPIERVKEKSIIPYVDHTTPLSVTRPHSDSKLAWLFGEVWYTSVRRGAAGKSDFVVDGGTSNVNRSKSRGGLIKPITHNDIGLAGLLKIIGFNYEEETK